MNIKLINTLKSLIKADKEIYDRPTTTYIQFQQHVDGIKIESGFWSRSDMKKLKLSGQEILAYEAMVKEQENMLTIKVSFCHDIEDSWYNAEFPNPEYNGSYETHTSIDHIAKHNNWTIQWIGNSFFNPWKK